MSYIDRNLLPDERILFRTKKHLIVFLYPLIMVVFSVYAANYMHNNQFLAKIDWLPGLAALIYGSAVAFDYFFSEYAVTNRRIMMREGFVFRHTNETRISSISQVNVYQNLLGQLLNYGSIVINAFGANDVFVTIDKPVLFQQMVNQELDKIAR